MERSIGIALYDEEIRRFPRDMGRRGIGQRSLFHALSLLLGLPGNLVGSRKIQPIARFVRIQANRGLEILDGWIEARA